MDTITININVSLDDKTRAFISSLLGAKPAAATVQATPTLEHKATPAPVEAKESKTKVVAPEELRAAVKEAKSRTSADAVREIFYKYGIASSSECPEEQRSALLIDLNALGNA